MKSVRVLLVFFFYLTLTNPLSGQKNDVGVWQWKDHLGFYSCNSVAALGPFRIASNYSSLLLYNTEDGSMKKKNRINGLSDVGVRLIRSTPDNKKLVIVYENSNIDIMDESEEIANYSDIKTKIINANKVINDITFEGTYAYLSCGFGIIKFDMVKNEIRDSYFFGPGGTYIMVYQTCITDSVMFAATSKGLYRCPHKIKNPADYQNWTQITGNGMRSIPYSGAVKFKNKVIAAQSNYLLNNTPMKDTLFEWDGTTWQIFSGKGLPYHIKKMYVQNNLMWMIDMFGAQIYENTNAFKDYVTTYQGNGLRVTDVYAELQGGYPKYWISDAEYGFLMTTGSSPYFPIESFNTGGLRSSEISNIDIHNGIIAISPSYVNNDGTALYSSRGINVRTKDGEWKYLRKPGFPYDTLFDWCHVLIDRKNSDIIWGSSWVEGLAEFRNYDLYKIYNQYNTGGAITAVLPNWWRVSGKAMNEDGDMWFAVSDVSEYLCVRTKDGIFQKFTIDGMQRFVRKLLVLKNGDVWVLHEREGGITVVRPKKNNGLYVLEKIKILNKYEKSGNLGSNSVYSAVEDRDGNVWVGTATGIRVFSNPDNVFTEPDGQPIKIIQGKNVELLLENETITCMDVDAANQKWVGTLTGGVYCFSPDGQKTIFHFTTNNSPLYSDEIREVKIDQQTGDVYIATPFGLQSFRNIYIDPYENYDELHAFPNPVKRNYSGSVFITGLMENSQVKITDVAGNIVWEGKVPGGRIEWALTNSKSERVPPGVYIVYASLTTGEVKKLGKILVL